MRTNYLLIIIAACFGLNINPAQAKDDKPSIQSPQTETWEAIGLNIFDGNTLEVSKDGRVYRLLLAKVGAPARGQPFSKEARQALKDMVYGQKLKVIIEKEDRIGRLIAQVYVGERHINMEMIKNGWAWVYRHYTNDPKWISLEETARKGKLGLWADEKPVAPWEYRQQQRKLRAEQQKDDPVNATPLKDHPKAQ